MAPITVSYGSNICRQAGAGGLGKGMETAEAIPDWLRYLYNLLISLELQPNRSRCLTKQALVDIPTGREGAHDRFALFILCIQNFLGRRGCAGAIRSARRLLRHPAGAMCAHF
jgi:hypothetical protein